MDLIDNKDHQRFELPEEGGTVIANYRRASGLIEITYVESPPALRGTGAAGRMMEALMDIARGEGARIRPICGYAHAWMRRHPDHHDLMA